MTTTVDEMDTVTEPVTAKSEPKDGTPSIHADEPPPSVTDLKVERREEVSLPQSKSVSDMEVSVSPAVQTPTQLMSPQAQISSLPEQKETDNPPDGLPSAEPAEKPEQTEHPQHVEKPEEAEHIASVKADSEHTASVIGNHQGQNGNNEDNNEELTPPPESSPEPSLSSDSSVQPNTLEDEIVVGTGASHHKSRVAQVTPDSEDIVMGDAEEESTVGQYPKRKRTSAIYAESVDDKDDSPAPRDEQEGARRAVPPTKAHGVGNVKGVVLGFWRDSPPENDDEKHGVIGFIDVRDRLRTRIQPTTRNGYIVNQRYPIPPGPGGSWVTFDKVAFADHLVGLTHHVVKEYVKIRVETTRPDETPEEKAKLDLEARDLAIERLRANPPPESAVGPLIAYGTDIPHNAVLPKPETKRRRLLGQFNSPSNSPGQAQQGVDDIPGTRPTRIPIGVWKHSSEQNPLDKHMVCGILGANDMFRVKLTRETRDGRPVHGNFPTGAGGLWIHWDEVEFEPHLRNLPRAEIKEYCRVRQSQIDQGETADQRAANEAAALVEAQQRVARSIALGIPIRKDDSDLPAIAMKSPAVTNGTGRDTSGPSGAAVLAAKPDSGGGGPQNSTTPATTTRAGRHPLPEVQFGTANRAPPNPAVVERTNSIARREVARVEAAQARADQRAASREASLTPTAGSNNNNTNNDHPTSAATSSSDSRSMFQDNFARLNKVWAAQEANRIRAGGEDAKIYMGIKYERKQTGPFQGKLVSQGTIISIDGEDYVEYRVLTKPTFF